MPSIITHSVVGIFWASLFETKTNKIKFWFFSIFCTIIPDFDVVAFKLGISYEDFFGHRGFFHSLVFAFIFAILIVFLFFRNVKINSFAKYGLIIYFFILTASHGLLDTLTSGGLGIALFSPFDNARYFYSFTPIKVSPIGVGAFFSERGLMVLKSEIIWVWIPLIISFLTIKVFQKILYALKTK
ncbi:putative membrane-bound metal-dependent hydrolase [Sulfurovum sp. enrichment culture clone C5]|uniref:Putative membrane-bound metal-dependent hydrolase n=1 Tax=Sulfurovum sp. enrichment culture clone C5 TaxID=497650 RepID=A0A0S4XMF9_9BACT|nr:putative membrane-bound metal-dependent hydrolase [Sulfurovum sp. enrichment culture clone C5]